MTEFKLLQLYKGQMKYRLKDPLYRNYIFGDINILTIGFYITTDSTLNDRVSIRKISS